MMTVQQDRYVDDSFQPYDTAEKSVGGIRVNSANIVIDIQLRTLTTMDTGVVISALINAYKKASLLGQASERAAMFVLSFPPFFSKEGIRMKLGTKNTHQVRLALCKEQ